MEKQQLRPHHYRGWIFGIISIFFAIVATMVSISYQHQDSLFCQGLLGAGFPASLICDASGESPLSSVGKINWADLDNINPFGALVDILFYTMMLSVASIIMRRKYLTRR